MVKVTMPWKIAVAVCLYTSAASAATEKVNFHNMCSHPIELYHSQQGSAVAKVADIATGGCFETTVTGPAHMYRHTANTSATLFEIACDGTIWHDISIIPPLPGWCSSYEDCKGGGTKTGFNVPMSVVPQSNIGMMTCRPLTCAADSKVECADAYHYPMDNTKTHSCPTGTVLDVTFCFNNDGTQSLGPQNPVQNDQQHQDEQNNPYQQDPALVDPTQTAIQQTPLDKLPVQELPLVPSVPGIQSLPSLQSVAAAPVVPGLPAVPELPAAPGLPTVPGLPPVSRALPETNNLASTSTLQGVVDQIPLQQSLVPPPAPVGPVPAPGGQAPVPVGQTPTSPSYNPDQNPTQTALNPDQNPTQTALSPDQYGQSPYEQSSPVNGTLGEVRVTYSYIGKEAGNVPVEYGRVVELKHCKKEPVHIHYPVGPMFEPVTMVFRGPMAIRNIAVYSDENNTGSWDRVSSYSSESRTVENMVFLSNMNVDYSGEGKHGPQGYASADGKTKADVPTVFDGFLDEASDPTKIGGGPGVSMGVEVNIMTGEKCDGTCLGFHGDNDYKGWGGGKKAFFTEVMMPKGAVPDLPAVWILNAQVVHTNQYQCNCRGVGSVAGCGELNIAEVIETNILRDKVTTHLYFNDGKIVSPNGDNFADRRYDYFTVYVTLIDDSNGGLIKIIELANFDFSLKSLGSLYQQLLDA